MTPHVRRYAIAARILVCAGFAACHNGQAVDPSIPLEAPKDAISKPVEHGPVKVAVKVWPAKPSLSEPIYLRLEIASTPGVSVNAPFQEAGDQRLGRFRIVGFTRDGAGSLREVQTYTLEAPASGKQRIPPLRLEVIDGRPGHVDTHTGSGSGSTTGSSSATGSGSNTANASGAASASSITTAQEVLTEEIALDIAPVSSEQLTAKMHGASGELDPNVGGVPWMVILLVASALAVIGSGIVLALRARAARRNVAARRSAYDEAVTRLAQLEQHGAPEAAHADAWFVDLSDIVRSYLEHRYEIRAPELTTEEFLLVASQATALTAEHRALLSAFLVRCDRVKFAGYRPNSDESLASLKAARAFVEDARLRVLE